MNVLLLGSGGREHALAWKIKQSPKVSRLFIAPGNAGTALEGTNVAIDPADFEALKTLALEKRVDMVVVGPEAPLIKGVYNFFQNDPALCRIPLIGPSREGARLEGSKDFAKAFMMRRQIPTARYLSVDKENLAEGFAFLDNLAPPYVLKADGPAAGKGVLIVDSLGEAKKQLGEMLDGKFGEASRKVVVEEFLQGVECSVFALTDGNSYLVLPVAKDYKRIGEADTGLNTGGMGAVSPVPFAEGEFMRKTEERIIRPTVEGLKAEGVCYKGFLFFGLINVKGEPFVIEYNCRMGDPEAQAVVPRIRNDLAGLFESLASGRLHEHRLEEDPRAVATVVLVSGGYPGAYESGKPIAGLQAGLPAGTIVFHAGTRAAADGRALTQGGRVLAVSSYGAGMKEALAQSYDAISRIGFDNMYFRRDIGFDL